jgi:hypothetical protein
METLIDNATSDWLIQPDWRLNIDIVQRVDASKYVAILHPSIQPTS